MEPAPHTSLRADTAEERWEGFWCDADERYYTRCARADGTESWFRLVDAIPADDAAVATARIFRFPSSLTAGRAMMSGMRLRADAAMRPVLVGKSRRAPRSRTAGAGGGH